MEAGGAQVNTALAMCRQALVFGARFLVMRHQIAIFVAVFLFPISVLAREKIGG